MRFHGSDALVIAGTIVVLLSLVALCMSPLTRYMNKVGLTATIGPQRSGETSHDSQERLIGADRRLLARMRKLRPVLLTALVIGLAIIGLGVALGA